MKQISNKLIRAFWAKMKSLGMSDEAYNILYDLMPCSFDKKKGRASLHKLDNNQLALVLDMLSGNYRKRTGVYGFMSKAQHDIIERILREMNKDWGLIVHIAKHTFEIEEPGDHCQYVSKELMRKIIKVLIQIKRRDEPRGIA